jgi:hypothetical protein
MAVITPKLLQACLDVYHHPAWISDQFGSLIASNCLAEEINIHELDLSKVIIKIKNKKFKYTQKELNHGTNCYLNELEDEEETIDEFLNRLGDEINEDKETKEYGEGILVGRVGRNPKRYH